MEDGQEQKHAALRELRDADRVYRAAFQRILTTDDLRPSSFRDLLHAVERIEEVVRRLEEGHNEMGGRNEMAENDESPSELIDAKIAELGDWRGDLLARVRALIAEADPGVVEEVKWRKPSNSMLGVPVWSHAGIICTGEAYRDKVKLTFAKGASLADPSGLFNASLGGNTRRAIDLHEGDVIDESAFKALIRAAVTLNES